MRGARWTLCGLIFAVGLFCFLGTARPYEIGEMLSIEGVLAGAVQYREVSDERSEFGDVARWAAPFQPEISFTPTENDEFFLKFGFAAGKGLGKVTPSFSLSPWAADLEEDVKDINGRNRDYLLTAGYKHKFRFRKDHYIEVSAGIIDATEYVDQNRYANDEYTQFMNQALVNGPGGFAPSYDVGAAVEWEIGRFSVKGVSMGIGRNEDGNSYNYYAVQMAVHPEIAFGRGNYRLNLSQTTSDFLDPAGERLVARKGTLISFDQELGKLLGAWVRFGWGNDAPVRLWRDLYTGGIDIKGRSWNREKDNIGIGFAHLSGGNQEIDRSNVLETYYRFVFTEMLAATADLQYLEDDDRESGERKGWIFGLRLTVEF